MPRAVRQRRTSAAAPAMSSPPSSPAAPYPSSPPSPLPPRSPQLPRSCRRLGPRASVGHHPHAAELARPPNVSPPPETPVVPVENSEKDDKGNLTGGDEVPPAMFPCHEVLVSAPPVGLDRLGEE